MLRCGLSADDATRGSTGALAWHTARLVAYCFHSTRFSIRVTETTLTVPNRRQ